MRAARRSPVVQWKLNGNTPWRSSRGLVGGTGCRWNGLSVERVVGGTGCRWNGLSVERAVGGTGCRWNGLSVERAVGGAGCLRMPEASQPVAGRWSGSDTTGKLPLI